MRSTRQISAFCVGLLAVAGLVVSLIAGDACMPVPMRYDQRPDAPGNRIYSAPAPQPASTNRPAH